MAKINFLSDELIYTGTSQISVLKMGLKLEQVLDDFKATCGTVAELRIEGNNIIATYIQDNHWSGFLSGVAYALDNFK